MGWRVQRFCIVAYRDRGLESDRDREISKSRGDYATMIREQHDLSQ
jgi:hypothetical protein